MANPAQQLLGRDRFYTGARPEEFFPQAPDLGYLGQFNPQDAPPEFMGVDESYDPQADFASIMQLGFSPEGAQALMPLSRQLIGQQSKRRAHQEAQAALEELKGVDYSSPKLSNKLLSIFQKYPNARKSPEVIDQIDFFTKLKPQAEVFDVESIDDPIAYSYAKKNGLESLSPREAKRKLALHAANREIEAQAVDAGLSSADLAPAFDADAGAYDPIKVSEIIKRGRYNPLEETDPEVQAMGMVNNWGNLDRPTAARAKAVMLANRKTELEMARAGIQPEQMESFKDPATGLYDVRKVVAATSQPKAPPIEAIKEIAEYESKIPEEKAMMVDDSNKLAWLQRKFNDPERTSFSPEDWAEAYRTLGSQPTPSEVARDRFISMMNPQRPSAKPQPTEVKTSSNPQVDDILRRVQEARAKQSK